MFLKLPQIPRRRLLGLAAVLLIALGWHLEAASRFDPQSLAPTPGPLVLDRQGRMLRLGADAGARRLMKLPPGELPEMAAAAFVAAEDQGFWTHPGIDPLAVARAALSNVSASRIVSGASTITMQLARLTYPGPRTYYHKVVEMVRSLRMERALSKREILRCYLERVPMGNNLMGVEAAAQLYFGKPASRLTAAEAALLAALARAPGTLNPYGPHRGRLIKRQERVLSRMARLGLLNPQDYAAAVGEPVRFREAGGRRPRFPFEAPHLVNLVLSTPGNTGSPIRTTLDVDLQRRAAAIVASHRANLLKGGATQAAAVMVDNHSLEVLALVGSLRYRARDRGFNNGAAAWRSPGSTLKPFLYALALDLGFTPASILEDVERRYQTAQGEFIPANYDRFPHGPISFREALANSLNLSAVSLLHLIQPQVYYDTLSRLRLINRPERGPDHYGLGLVVGNPEVSLLQLATAYACLANGGLFRPLRLRLDDIDEPGVRIFSSQAAYIINDILSDPMARFRIFGASTAMNPPYRLAIKTGTSTRYRDCWAVGYTPEYTIAVWVGNFDGRPTANLSGAAAAAPILADLAAAVLREPVRHFVRPEGVATAVVCHFSGLLPGPHCGHVRQELFLAGTEPTGPCTYHHQREPWHRMPTTFAGWLHQRYSQGGVGRYRLAGFDPDLPRVFQNPDSAEDAVPVVPLPPHGKVTLGLNPAGGNFRSPAAAGEPPLTIAYPLNGDRYLLAPQAETLPINLKVISRTPLKSVTCFVDGREVATIGPPYETTLKLGRGRHRLTVVGPDSLGDAVEVVLQ